MPPPEPLRRSAALLPGLLGIALAAGLDHVLGAGLHVAPLYAVPVALAAWVLGRRAGLGTALLAAAAGTVVNAFAGGTPFGWPLRAGAAATLLAALVAVAWFAAELRGRRDLVGELTRVDGLTGLANEAAFRERIAQEAARTRRWKRPVTLALLEADGLDALRKAYDGGTVDEVLRTVSVALRTTVRETDFVARLSTGTFVLLFPETDAQASKHVLERVSERIQQDVARSGWPVTVSVASLSTAEIASVESLLRHVGQLLFEVKKGRTSPPRGPA